jgi:hypothetical protein
MHPLGKTWQIKLYSGAFECATMRNTNYNEYAVFPLKCVSPSVIGKDRFAASVDF